MRKHRNRIAVAAAAILAALALTACSGSGKAKDVDVAKTADALYETVNAKDSLSETQKEQLDHQLALLQSLTHNGRAARENHPAAEITFFEACTDPENFAFGKGGQYQTITGTVSKVDTLVSRTITIDGQSISLDTVSEITIL